MVKARGPLIRNYRPENLEGRKRCWPSGDIGTRHWNLCTRGCGSLTPLLPWDPVSFNAALFFFFFFLHGCCFTSVRHVLVFDWFQCESDFPELPNPTVSRK